MSTLNVDKVDPSTGTALELGTSGDTITVPTGAGLTVTDEVKTNKISPATGTAFALGDSGDTFTVPSGATIVNSGTATGFGGGKIGQVVQTVKTDTATTTVDPDAFEAISGMTVDITPTATSSKVLVMTNLHLCNTIATYHTLYQIFRDSTQIYMGDAADDRARVSGSLRESLVQSVTSMSEIYLDSPSSTSAVTYSLKWAAEATSTGTLNRSGNDIDRLDYPRLASSITVMEVLA